MKFREHRGSLYESMETLVEIKDKAELVDYVKGILQGFPVHPKVSDETVNVNLYAGAGDDRIGWKEVYIVTLRDYGVLGFSDGPCE